MIFDQLLAFVDFDASHASLFDVTASDFKRGIPKETSRESAAEVAYARSYEEPTPGSGDRPFGEASRGRRPGRPLGLGAPEGAAPRAVRWTSF